MAGGTGMKSADISIDPALGFNICRVGPPIQISITCLDHHASGGHSSPPESHDTGHRRITPHRKETSVCLLSPPARVINIFSGHLYQYGCWMWSGKGRTLIRIVISEQPVTGHSGDLINASFLCFPLRYLIWWRWRWNKWRRCWGRA